MVVLKVVLMVEKRVEQKAAMRAVYSVDRKAGLKVDY